MWAALISVSKRSVRGKGEPGPGRTVVFTFRWDGVCTFPLYASHKLQQKIINVSSQNVLWSSFCNSACFKKRFCMYLHFSHATGTWVGAVCPWPLQTGRVVELQRSPSAAFPPCLALRAGWRQQDLLQATDSFTWPLQAVSALGRTVFRIRFWFFTVCNKDKPFLGRDSLCVCLRECSRSGNNPSFWQAELEPQRGVG